MTTVETGEGGMKAIEWNTAQPVSDVVETEPSFRWRYIESAPREGRFDVWAKRWVSRDDTFEYRRFSDCYWRSTHVAGCPKEWKPTHWCPILPPPEGF